MVHPMLSHFNLVRMLTYHKVHCEVGLLRMVVADEDQFFDNNAVVRNSTQFRLLLQQMLALRSVPTKGVFSLAGGAGT